MISTLGFLGSLSWSLCSFLQSCLGSIADLNAVRGGSRWLRGGRFFGLCRGLRRSLGLNCACGCRIGWRCACYRTNHFGGPYSLYDTIGWNQRNFTLSPEAAGGSGDFGRSVGLARRPTIVSFREVLLWRLALV